MRKAKQYTLKELGERTALSVSFLSEIERGLVNPSIVTLKKILDVYGMPLWIFFLGIDESIILEGRE